MLVIQGILQGLSSLRFMLLAEGNKKEVYDLHHSILIISSIYKESIVEYMGLEVHYCTFFPVGAAPLTGKKHYYKGRNKREKRGYRNKNPRGTIE